MKKAFSILAALIPALIAYLILWKTQDGLITLLAVIILGFVVPIVVFIKFIGEFNYELKLPEEIIKKDEKISQGGTLLAGGFVGLSVLVILWCRFAPTWAGPQSVTYPFPIFTSAALKILYYFFFTLFFIIAAVLEHFYFNYFFSIIYNEKEIAGAPGGKLGSLASAGLSAATGTDGPSFFSNLILSLGVGLLNFAVFKWTVAPTLWSAVILAILTFVLNIVILGIRAEKKMIVSTLLRVGIALAVLVILMYLGLSVKYEWTRKNPDFVFVGNVNNGFTRWFGKTKTATA